MLIRLQELSSLANIEKLGDDSADGEEALKGAEAFDEALQQVDGLISLQTSETLAIVHRLQFDQLRAAGPRLSREHPEELVALIDVMLRGELGDNELLRRIEFLITLLCSEEWNGRLTVVHEPSDLTPGLRQLAREMSDLPEIAVVEAEQVLRDAQARLIESDAQPSIRNEIRE